MIHLRYIYVIRNVILFISAATAQDCSNYTYYATWTGQELSWSSLNTDHCDLILKSPRDHNVLLNITALDQTCCSIIEIFDNDFLLGSFNRQSNLPITLVSYSTALRIRFYTRANNPPYTGFQAIFRQANNCGTRFTTNSLWKSFETPKFLNRFSEGLDCYWQISSRSEDEKIELKISNSTTLQSCCEYVEIISAGTKRLAKVVDTIPNHSAYISIGHVMSVFYHSNKNTNRSSFNMTFRKALCGETSFLYANEAPQTISSPSYPDGSNHILDCTYRFYAPEYHRVKLTIWLNTRYKEDYLEVINENNAVVRLSGKVRKTVTSSHIMLHLRSKRASAGIGFRAIYRPVQIPCSHSYGAEKKYQEITSLGYPRSYPSGVECNWVLKAPEKYQVILLLRYLDTEQCCDYVEIFDGNKLLGRHSGTIPTDIGFASSGRILRVRFRPNADVVRNGFSAIFKKATNCGASITATRNETIISTPGYPNRYISDLGCHWRIHSKKSLQIQFEVLSGETERCCDSLQIVDDTTHLSRLLGDFKTPATFLSTSSYMSVYFHSDASTNGEGFIGRIKEVCKYTYRVSYSFYFSAYSPHYPEPSPNDLDCEYTFVPSAKQDHVEIFIKHLDTEACCDYIEMDDEESLKYIGLIMSYDKKKYGHVQLSMILI